MSVRDDGIDADSEYHEQAVTAFERLRSRGAYEGATGLVRWKRFRRRRGRRLEIESRVRGEYRIDERRDGTGG